MTYEGQPQPDLGGSIPTEPNWLDAEKEREAEEAHNQHVRAMADMARRAAGLPPKDERLAPSQRPHSPEAVSQIEEVTRNGAIVRGEVGPTPPTPEQEEAARQRVRAAYESWGDEAPIEARPDDSSQSNQSN